MRAHDDVSGIVAELVGYSVELGDDRPRLIGRSTAADFRLHSAPIGRQAAVLFPVKSEDGDWRVAPAEPAQSLRLLDLDCERQGASRVVETSVRPWSAGERSPQLLRCDGLSTMKLTPEELAGVWVLRPGKEGEAKLLLLDFESDGIYRTGSLDLLHCRQDGERASAAVWWAPAGAARGRPPEAVCTEELASWNRVERCRWLRRSAICFDPSESGWAMHFDQDSFGTHTARPWSRELLGAGVWLSLGTTLSEVWVGVAAAPASALCPDGPCPPVEPPTRCWLDRSAEETQFGLLELHEGDRLAIGKTRFLACRPFRAVGSEGLQLLHVHDPAAGSYFRVAAGAEVYHPNRKGTWNVPDCGVEVLTLALAADSLGSSPVDQSEAAADLLSFDRALRRRIDQVAYSRGARHELPVADRSAGVRSGSLSLCTERSGSGEIRLRIGANVIPAVQLATGPAAVETLAAGVRRAVPLGTQRLPREVAVSFGGNVIRIAPAAGARVTRQLRLETAAFLIAILALQALPLTWARQARRRRLAAEPLLAAEVAWPAVAGAATLLQLVGIAICWLMFVGASYQLFLGLHPQLVGKPDYLQAFLQGMVVVGAVLTAAAGLAAGGRGLGRRFAGATFGVAAACLMGALWWWLDALATPSGLWLAALRNNPETGWSFGKGTLTLGALCLAAALGAPAIERLLRSRCAEQVLQLVLARPVLFFLASVAAGAPLVKAQGSALALELSILVGLAGYAAVYWSFVRYSRSSGKDRWRQAAARSLVAGSLLLVFLILFFAIGSALPTPISLGLVAAGIGVLLLALRVILRERLSTLRRVFGLWLLAIALGASVASVGLRDMGSVAAWIPAALAGLFLWIVRPEEHDDRRGEPQRARVHLLLALGMGLTLLGILDLFAIAIEAVDWQLLERPRQRLTLAEDVSYITPGGWITQVRWLASRWDSDMQWVPNMNSDVAVFGLAANFGFAAAVFSSLLLLLIACAAAVAADQALREARVRVRGKEDPLSPVLHRAAGLFLGMVGALLITQWLVHLATGVVLHLPITGLVFPWISHGNTTHVLYTLALALPLALLSALGEQPSSAAGGLGR